MAVVVEDNNTAERVIAINVRMASHFSACFECKVIYLTHYIMVLGIYEETPEKE